MSLVEEAKDPSTDARSDEAVRRAEQALKNFDQTMANAVRRYKVERGWNNASLAQKISLQEHTLAKGFCLLCEQTGYGAEDDDTGGTLMEETRNVMTIWKGEVGYEVFCNCRSHLLTLLLKYDDCEDQLLSD